MRIVRNAYGSRAPFDFVTITLHWFTATLIVSQAMSGLALEFAKDVVPIQPMLDFHRSVGTIVWCVALTRIVWRSTLAEFPPFPAWMSNTQRRMATTMEYALYAQLLLLPLTGLAATLVLGKPFHVLFLTVPSLVPTSLNLLGPLIAAHRIAAYCLFASISAHAGMALIHHYVFRDEVLERMAPWMRRKPKPLAPVTGSVKSSTASSNDNRRAA